MTELSVINQSQVLWGKCFDDRVCYDFGFPIGEVCTPKIGFCIYILIDRGALILRLQVGQQNVDYELANACIPAFTTGIFTIKVCLSDVDIDGTALRGIRIRIDLCAGIENLGEYCTKVYEEEIRFFTFAPGSRLPDNREVSVIAVTGEDTFNPA